MEGELANTRLRVAYVGTRTTHLKGEYDQNAPIYDPNLTLAENRATIDARRPLQGFQTIDRWFHGLNANYNSLQVSMDKRYSDGFTILGLIYVVEGNGLPIDQPGGEGRGPFRSIQLLLRSRSDHQNRTHRFVTSFLWDLPGQKLGSRRSARRSWRLETERDCDSSIGTPFYHSERLAIHSPVFPGHEPT